MSYNQSISGIAVSEKILNVLILANFILWTVYVYQVWYRSFLLTGLAIFLMIFFVVKGKSNLFKSIRAKRYGFFLELAISLYMTSIDFVPTQGPVFNIIISYAVLYIGVKESIVMTYITYFIFSFYNPDILLQEPGGILRALPDGINVGIFLAGVTLGKMQIIRAEKARQMTLQLEKQSKELEELVVIRERNRIAGDMHDTVGHTLSLAIIEMEACKALFLKNQDLALSKLLSSREHVSDALGEIRSTVKAFKDPVCNKNLQKCIEDLCEKSSSNNVLDLDCHIHIHSEIHSIIKKVMIQAVKECLTNVIKHSDTKHAHLSVNENDGVLLMECTSEHNSAMTLERGFGLRNMEERFMSIGGLLQIDIRGGKFIVRGAIPCELLEDNND